MFAILRIQKLKNDNQIKAAENHNSRKYKVENSNPDIENINLNNFFKNEISHLNSLNLKINQRLVNCGISKTRKDAIKAVEVLLTASPEFFKNLDIKNFKKDKKFTEWVKENINFIKNEFGIENILKVDLHLDEKTPHIHLIFIPITKNNKLSMKDLYGGKLKLSNLQNRYFKNMEKFELKRGNKNAKAKHTEIKKYYEIINKLKFLNSDQLIKINNLITQFSLENKIKNSQKTMIDDKNINHRSSNLKFKI